VSHRFTVELYPDRIGGGYTVVVPALPGCVTQGKDVAQSLERAREAIAGYLDCLRADGKPIPVEEEPEGRIRVEVAA
jgi:predicted RNase H-like HicB family nuclease